SDVCSSDLIGETHEGVISGIMNFGMFVELPNTIEGLVHVSMMTDDHYQYHERQMSMIGDRTGNVYRIGDPVEIEVVDVKLSEKHIDFKITGMPERAPRERKDRPVEIKAKSKKDGSRSKSWSRQKNDKGSDNGNTNKKPFYKGAKKAAKKRNRKK